MAESKDDFQKFFLGEQKASSSPTSDTTTTTTTTTRNLRSLLYQTTLSANLKQQQAAEEKQRFRHRHFRWRDVPCQDVDSSAQIEFFAKIRNKETDSVLQELDQNPFCLKWRAVGSNPLGYACWINDEIVVNAMLDLIQCHSDLEDEINFRDSKGQTPLFHACFHGNASLTERLLLLEADANLLDETRWGPIVYAAVGGHDDVFRTLIDRGDVDLNAIYEIYYNKFKGTFRDKRRQILHFLAKGRHPMQQLSMAADLLRRSTSMIDMRAATGKTALHEACSQSFVQMVKLLLEYGAKVNVRDSTNRTPLHVSFTETFTWSRRLSDDSLEVLQFLLQQPGVEVDSKDCYGATPLMRACMVGDVRAVKSLVAAGADFRLFEQKGRRLPVHFAARDQHADVLDFLLSLDKRQSNLVQWIDYGTPLLTLLSHCHARGAHVDVDAALGCVKAALRHGADAARRNAFDASAAEMAATKRLWRAARILVLAGDDARGLRKSVDEELARSEMRERKVVEDRRREEMSAILSEERLGDDFDSFLGYTDDEDPDETLPFTDHDNWAPETELRELTPEEGEAWLWCQNLLLTAPLTLAQSARVVARRAIGDRMSIVCETGVIPGVPKLVVDYLRMLEETD